MTDGEQDTRGEPNVLERVGPVSVQMVPSGRIELPTPINTAKTPGLTPTHRGLRQPWKPGESGNPAGRPKGSRNKLSEEFIAEVYADWCEHGAAAIETVRETRPDVYVKVVASLLPRQVQAEVTGPTHEERVAALAEKLAEFDCARQPTDVRVE